MKCGDYKMSEAEAKPALPMQSTVHIQYCNSSPSIHCPSLQVTSRMLRSPSHESVTTDLSLFSVSSITSELRNPNRLATFKSYTDVHVDARGPSPKPDTRQIQSNRPANIPEILWFEEENELIRSCGQLSSALGLRKSFSASDVTQLPSPDTAASNRLRLTVSALVLDNSQRNTLLLEHTGLNHTSRSCSTWVAIGEPIANTSQLPSPRGGAVQEQRPQQESATSQSTTELPPVPSSSSVSFTDADLVRSLNKKIRQNYIRRRLLTTYRALERLSQSEFNLDQLEAAASAAKRTTTLLIPGKTATVSGSFLLGLKDQNRRLTIKDVERERGNQLSKYERNMMIFNWLHTLDDNTNVDCTE